MSLKEIKNRITSVASTRKTTSAMKMVSGVKLRKAQQSIQYALPYMARLHGMLSDLTVMPTTAQVSALMKSREVKNVALICFSSDTSLCGGFNSNMIKHVKSLIKELCLIDSEPHIYCVGQKITDALSKESIKINNGYSSMMATRNYSDAASLADDLIDMFENGYIDKVILSYTHFVSAGSWQIIDEVLLPVPEPAASDSQVSLETQEQDYILEPSAQELIEALLPKVIRMKLYCAMLDSYTSEQAARVIAMQAATENADKLIDELTLQYNKLRQQAITNEILDLAAGACE